MNLFPNKKFITIILFHFWVNLLCGQNMSTPYSVYGTGDIDHRKYNFNTGMGYTGLALKTSLYSSGNNPASAAGLEKSVFMFDLNTAGRIVSYSGNAIDTSNSNNRDFVIKKLSFTTKLNKIWASGIGMKQFSTVSYQFYSNKVIEGSNDTYLMQYSGDGGLNEYYWNNSFAIGKHLLAGLTASFLGGPINQTEIIADNSGNSVETKRRDYYGNGRLQYGLIYYGSISKKWKASLGTTFSNTTKMNYERSITVTQNSVVVLKDEFIKYSNTPLPRSYGIGIALSNNKGITIAADYNLDEWSALDVKGSNYKFINSNRFSAGIEFASTKQSYYGVTQASSIQLGAFLNNSYLMVNQHQIQEWGITAGVTKTVKNSLRIGASIDAGTRGTIQNGLIKENFIQFNLNFSYRDFFNSKGIKYN
jgi:hypothetical protein